MQSVRAQSVFSKIVCKLRDRLLAIDGQGAMVNDLQGRVFLRRPTYDVDHEKAPSLFLRGFTITRTVLIPGTTFYSTTAVFGMIGIVASDDAETLAGVELKADMYRALEVKGDEYLRDDDCGANLLNQELVIVDSQTEDLQAGMAFDAVSLGVQCTFPQTYGDPNDVQ